MVVNHILEDFQFRSEGLRHIRQYAKNPGAWLPVGMHSTGDVHGNVGVVEDRLINDN